MRLRNAKSEAGFTLLEMLLAAMITAVVVGATYAVYISSLRSSQEGTMELTCIQRGRAILDGIADDLRSSMVTGGVFAYGIRGTDGEELDLPMSDQLELTATTAVRWRPEPEGMTAEPATPVSDFREITYRVITPEESAAAETETGVPPSLGLIRQVREIRSTLATIADADPPRVQVLSRQVVWLNFEYFDGTDWQVVWDSGQSRLLPLAVRVTLVVVPDDVDIVAQAELAEGTTYEERYPGAKTFSTVVSLPLAVAPEGLRIMGGPTLEP